MGLPQYGVCQHGVSDVVLVHARAASLGKPMVRSNSAGDYPHDAASREGLVFE